MTKQSFIKWEWQCAVGNDALRLTQNLCSVWIMSVSSFIRVMKTVSGWWMGEGWEGRTAAPLLTPGSEWWLWSRRTPSSLFGRRTRRWRSRLRWTERPRRRSPRGCPRCPLLWSPCSETAGCPSVASHHCHCERGTVDLESPNFTHGFTLWLIGEDEGGLRSRAILASAVSFCDWH